MSWAAHNPELYDEICQKAITGKLHSMSDGINSPDPAIDYDDLFLLVQDLCAEVPEVYDALLTWADKETGVAVGNHFADIGDAERSRRKEAG